MKTSMSIFLPAMLALIFACKNSSGGNASSALPEGVWQLDSVRLKKKPDLATAVTLMMMKQDDYGMRFRFADGWLFTSTSNKTDSLPMQYDAAGQRLQVLNTVKPTSYVYDSIDDSTCTLTLEDSSVYVLRRLPNP